MKEVREMLNFESFVPHGHGEDIIARADRFILFLLWAHLPIVSFLATHSYGTWKEALLASSIICFIGTVSYLVSRGTLGHRLLNGLLLLSYSIVLISIQYGRIEMHFHVFASLPFLIVYRDWKVFPPAATLIALHHSIFNYCQANNIKIFDFPLTVFNYANGWDIVILHSLFVVCQTGVLIYFSELLKKQHHEITEINSNLESLVEDRTKKLKAEKEKVEAYTKALNTVAITAQTDLKGRIIDINNNFEDISGYSKLEVIGKTHKLVNSSYHSKSFFKEMWDTIHSGKVWRGEIKNISKEGNEYWVDTAITPIKDESGEINSFIAIRFDITAKKEQEAIIHKQQEQIISQAKLSSLGEMAGGIAHEINNPLTIISATSFTLQSMIEKDRLRPEFLVKSLSNIDDTVIRITKIINGLRNISRDVQDETFDLCKVGDIFEDLMPLFSAKIKSFDIDLTLDMSKVVEETQIEVLRIPLSQVILNLMTNAFDEVQKYDKRWIKITAKTIDDNLKIEVIDCGLGIPSSIQSKMFDPFFTTKEIGKGTGLGLSLSHRIIEQHRGKFYIDNSNSNTCFVMIVPLSQSNQEQYKKVS